MRMKMLTLALLLALLCGLSAAGQEQVYDDLLADSLTLVHERNAAVTGTWRYASPVVQMAGVNLEGKLAKPLAKSKVRGKLKKALKKLGIAHKRTTLTLEPGGTWVLEPRGERAITGTYTLDASAGRLQLRWHGVTLPLTAELTGKRLQLTVPASNALATLRLLARLVPSEHLRDLARLAELYDHVSLGLALKR